MFTVYVLYSPSFKKIYVGFTSNLNERFKSHNELGTKGWTIKFRPWIICYKEEFETKQEAMRREKELKTAKLREWIWSLINEKIKAGSYPPNADGSSILPFGTKKPLKEAFTFYNFNVLFIAGANLRQ